jgi:tetratricopeptide (TPR) repeat protein
LNYLKASEDEFKKCIELGEIKHFESLMGVGSYLASIKLSEIQLKQGKHVLALESAFSALKLNNRFLPALNQYFTVLQSAGIDSLQIFNNLKQTFPIEDKDSLSMVIKVLFSNRSRILNQYIKDYNINVDNLVRMVAELYDNNYSEANSCLIGAEIPKEYFSDVITLGLIQKDSELFSRLLNNMNLNKKERKFMLSLFRDDLNHDVLVPESLTSIIINTLVSLLRLFEESVFWEVLGSVNLSDDNKLQLFKKMIDAGFLKQAVDILEKETVNKRNQKFQGLLADLYVRENKLQEALNIYTNLVDKVGDYSSYNRLYNLYEKINYKEGLNSVKKGMDQLI